jgi:hypothetical protein
MFLELDPGTNYDPSSNDDEFQNGDSIPLANTAPDTNVDQVLAALDTDTRAYLRLLLTEGGRASTAAARTSGSCWAASVRSTAASRASTRRLPSARRTCGR